MVIVENGLQEGGLMLRELKGARINAGVGRDLMADVEMEFEVENR